MTNSSPQLHIDNIIGLKVVLGINYIDQQTQELLAPRQYGGTVVTANQESVSIQIGAAPSEQFHLPSDLSAWFLAPPGDYRIPNTDITITHPNYLITWNVYRVKPKSEEDGQHEWWEWQPAAQAPQVKRT